MKDFKLVQNVLNNLQDGKYPIKELKTDEIVRDFKKIQVRAENTNDDKIKEIVEFVKEYNDDSNFDPITIIVDDDEIPIYLVDGNHTVHAREQLQYKFTPAYCIPYSDLWCKYDNAQKLGHALNKVDKVLDRSSDESIRNVIRDDMRRGIDIENQEYKKNLSRLLKRTLKGIGRMVSSIKGEVDGDPLTTNPRRLFTAEELQEIKEERELEDLDTTVVLGSTHGASGGQALGSLLKQMATDNNTSGLLILYHRNFNHETRHSHIITSLNVTIMYHELDIEIELLDFPRKDD